MVSIGRWGLQRVFYIVSPERCRPLLPALRAPRQRTTPAPD
jgi:hypothetical protein